MSLAGFEDDLMESLERDGEGRCEECRLLLCPRCNGVERHVHDCVGCQERTQDLACDKANCSCAKPAHLPHDHVPIVDPWGGEHGMDCASCQEEGP